jgi:drug/metabolite transporter (DMT)-like permease
MLKLLGIAVSFAMVGICTVLALRGGSNPLTIVMLRAIATVAIFIAYFRLSGVKLGLNARDRKCAVAMAIPLCINTYCINEAISEIPVPLAILIFYLWPAVVTAYGWLSGSESFRWPRLFGLVFAFTGIALALNVDLTATQMKGAVLAAISAFAWASAFLLTHRFFPGRDTRPVIVEMMAVNALVFTALTLASSAFQLPALPIGWVGMAGITAFYVIGTIGVFAATAHEGPARTGFFMNFEPVGTVLLSALILGQTLAPVQLAGAALVISALFLFRPPPRAAR